MILGIFSEITNEIFLEVLLYKYIYKFYFEERNSRNLFSIMFIRFLNSILRNLLYIYMYNIKRKYNSSTYLIIIAKRLSIECTRNMSHVSLTTFESIQLSDNRKKIIQIQNFNNCRVFFFGYIDIRSVYKSLLLLFVAKNIIVASILL